MRSLTTCGSNVTLPYLTKYSQDEAQYVVGEILIEPEELCGLLVPVSYLVNI